MLAVVEIKGKQYVITEKTVKLVVDSFPDKTVGDTIVVENVLLFQESADSETVFGAPFIEGKTLEFEIISQEKGDKVYGIKFKRRNRYMRRVNHRQIEATLVPAGAPKRESKPKTESADKKPVTVKKAAAKKPAKAKAPVKKAKTEKKQETAE